MDNTNEIQENIHALRSGAARDHGVDPTFADAEIHWVTGHREVSDERRDTGVRWRTVHESGYWRAVAATSQPVRVGAYVVQTVGGGYGLVLDDLAPTGPAADGLALRVEGLALEFATLDEAIAYGSLAIDGFVCQVERETAA